MSVVGNERRLVRSAREGNREAFSELAAIHWRRLLALARSVVADLEAEDIVQEGLIKAWRKLGSLKDEAAFAAWLTRIVANTAIARARRRRFFEPIEDVAAPSHGVTVDDRIDIARLLAKLAPRQRAVLHLTAIQGMTDSEISGCLGLSKSSVRVHRMRARKKMAEMVGRGDG